MEIELKYTVDEDLFARLLDGKSLADFELRSAGEQELTDLYLDTAERDILRGGYACRLRQVAGRATVQVTVKALGAADGALHRREEHELELPNASDPEDWPESTARELVLGLRGGAALHELVVIRQRRCLHSVLRAGSQFATLALDLLEIEGTPPLREIEIELDQGGKISDLRAFGRILESQGARPQALSKFERALALLDKPTSDGEDPGSATTPVPHTSLLLKEHGRDPQTPGGAPQQQPESIALLDCGLPEASGGPTADRSKSGKASAARRKGKAAPEVLAEEPLAEAGRKILAFHFERMLANEAGTRDGSDIESLHDMRVAIRRQRAALRIVAPEFQRKVIRPFRNELRAAGRCLGAVRDLDVQGEAAARYHSSLPQARARAFQPVLEMLHGRRQAARAELLQYLDSSSYINLKETHSRFLRSPGQGALRPAPDESGALAPHLVRDVLPGRIWQQYGALHAYATALPCASVQALHALRIDAKRLRYLLEFFRGLLDPRIDEGIESLVALQDHLGELHDADVTMEMLRQLVANRTETQPEVAGLVPAIGGYFEAQSLRLQTLRSTLWRPWKRVSSKRFKQLLARSTAGL